MSNSNERSFPWQCTAGNVKVRADWTYIEAAGFLSELAPLSNVERQAIRTVVHEYAERVARQEGYAPAKTIIDAIFELSEFMYNYGEELLVKEETEDFDFDEDELFVRVEKI